MFNENTQAVLNQLKNITPSGIFNYPITGLRDASKTIIAFIDLTKLGEDEFEEFGILQLREFCDLLGIAGKNSKASMENGSITIISDDLKCRYVTTDVDILESSFRVKTTMLTNVENANTAFSFNLTSQELDRIKKVSGLLNLENFTIASDNEKVIVTVNNDSLKAISSSNEFQMELGSIDLIEACTILLPINNVKKLPSGDYTVKVAKTPGDNVIIRFESNNVAGLTILIASKLDK